MKPIKNNLHIGQIFHYLTVVEEPISEKNGRGVKIRKCLCKCKCGKVKMVRVGDLMAKNVTSCGCFLKEKTGKMSRRHGMSAKKSYSVWAGMKSRCQHKGAKHFSSYGGRGIKVSKDRMSFEGFYNDMGEPPTPYHTIERLDVNGDYCKENCIWIHQSKQLWNTRKSVLYLGKPVSVWCKDLGISKGTVFSRIKSGRDVERSLFAPIGNNGPKSSGPQSP